LDDGPVRSNSIVGRKWVHRAFAKPQTRPPKPPLVFSSSVVGHSSFPLVGVVLAGGDELAGSFGGYGTPTHLAQTRASSDLVVC
jgi:hypothetical protein